jgi:flagellum-specific peptidoglycan hydrolase FlgJ
MLLQTMAVFSQHGPQIVEYKKLTTNDYIARYKDIAIREMERSGIPASITLAQGIHESGNGNSDLARKANNHFGIKCHEWKGQGYYMWDDDPKESCFRVYENGDSSYIDHTNFLMTRKRYAFLFEYESVDYVN